MPQNRLLTKLFNTCYYGFNETKQEVTEMNQHPSETTLWKYTHRITLHPAGYNAGIKTAMRHVSNCTQCQAAVARQTPIKPILNAAEMDTQLKWINNLMRAGVQNEI